MGACKTEHRYMYYKRNAIVSFLSYCLRAQTNEVTYASDSRQLAASMHVLISFIELLKLEVNESINRFGSSTTQVET